MSERPGGETAPAAWLVRGGELGEREEIALREGLVIAGWNELGDLSGCSSRESIRHALKLTYPEVADNVIRIGRASCENCRLSINVRAYINDTLDGTETSFAGGRLPTRKVAET